MRVQGPASALCFAGAISGGNDVGSLCLVVDLLKVNRLVSMLKCMRAASLVTVISLLNANRLGRLMKRVRVSYFVAAISLLKATCLVKVMKHVRAVAMARVQQRPVGHVRLRR